MDLDDYLDLIEYAGDSLQLARNTGSQKAAAEHLDDAINRCREAIAALDDDWPEHTCAGFGDAQEDCPACQQRIGLA